ncbi:MAG: glycosyltransferase family 4 protein [Candidatus Eisenbacteria bacterium]
MAKVLIFYQYYCTPNGSWGTRYYEFTRRWAAAGHDVTVVTSIYDKSDLVPRGFVTRFEIEGARILAMDLVLSNKHGMLRRLWTFFMYSLLSCWWALSMPADVVVASSGPITVGVPALLAHWLRHKPLLFEVRDLWPEGAIETGMLRAPWAIALARWFEKVCYDNATTVVALSPGMAEGVTRVSPRSRVVTIPNAADLDLFHPGHAVPDAVRAVADGRFVALYAGTLGRANGTLELVDIAQELARRGANDVEIVVIGDGAERERMETLARERGLTHLRFLGKRPKTEVAAWHEVAALTLCLFKPYRVVGTCSPNKLFDSLAAGRPVVNNTDGWMREMLDRTGSGLSYRAGDAAGAADRILALRDDPARRHAMADAARRTAEREFARDRLAAAFMELFPR